MSAFIQQLFSGPLDLVGDIHGEIDALRKLLSRLGYDERGQHPDGRRLVFLGDIVDRGPDSPAVVNCVRALVGSGAAQCVLGNHESNLIDGDFKAGNHWFFGEEERSGGPKSPYLPSKLLLDPRAREEMLQFFRTLPLALESEELRVVHACWDSEFIEIARGSTREELQALGRILPEEVPTALRLKAMKAELADESVVPVFNLELARFAESVQQRSPLKVITSGPEVVRASGEPAYLGGKWRCVQRDDWWDRYDGVPVVVGHYWRTRHPKRGASAEAIPYVSPKEWWGKGKVYCVDFSVGRRFKEREHGIVDDFKGALAALRWPEQSLVFDDGKDESAK